MDMRIRDFAAGDAPLLTELYRRSVTELASRHYGPAQIAAWAALAPTAARFVELAGDGRRRLVAVDRSDRPLAFADLEPDGHIHFFYCAPERAGTGTAARLYAALEEVARQWGLSRLHVEASEAARRFFEKRGFAVTARRDFDLGGVAIHNYAAEKALAESGGPANFPT